MNAHDTDAHAATALKLLAVALDPSAVDGEAINAATIFTRSARRNGVTFPILTLAAARLLPGPTPGPSRDHVAAPASGSAAAGQVRMPAGKFKGCRLADVMLDDVDYLRWVARAFDDGFVRRAAGAVLAAADQGDDR